MTATAAALRIPGGALGIGALLGDGVLVNYFDRSTFPLARHSNSITTGCSPLPPRFGFTTNGPPSNR